MLYIVFKKLTKNTGQKTDKNTDKNKTIKIYNKSDLMIKNQILELQTKNPDCLIISAKNKKA